MLSKAPPAFRDRLGRWQSRGRTELALKLGDPSVVARDLSERLGVTLATISALKQGVRRPSIDLAARIEELLGIPAATWTLADATEIGAVCSLPPRVR